VDLQHPLGGMPGIGGIAVPSVAAFEAHLVEPAGDRDHGGLSMSFTVTSTRR